MAFSVSEIDFHCQVTRRPARPFLLGPDLRGVLGAKLRAISCTTLALDCNACQEQSLCAYHIIFESKQISHNSLFPGMNSLPAAFVLKIPRPRWEIQPSLSDTFFFRVQLVGEAIQHYRSLIIALHRVGEDGLNGLKFTVKSIRSPLNQYVPERNGWDGQGLPPELVVDGLAGDTAPRVTVRFVSPVRIEKSGNARRTISPKMLGHFISRRLQVINTFYGDGEPLFDFKQLETQFAEIVTEQMNLKPFNGSRYSYRQIRKIPFTGYEGNIRYNHVPVEIGQLLQLGALVSVGKGTSMGFGHFYTKFMHLHSQTTQEETWES